jgi:PAS domain-containing protein
VLDTPLATADSQPPQSRALTFDALQVGDHLGCIYRTHDEHRQVVTAFLRLGLERHEKVIYLADTSSEEQILGYLRDDGLDPREFAASGQLSIVGPRDGYLKGGEFDPDRMMGVLREETDKALDEGYTALRVTGEMTWALGPAPGAHRLLEYQDKLNEFFPESSALAICLYDRRRFSPGSLLDVLGKHPLVLLGVDPVQNDHYVAPGGLMLLSTEEAALRYQLNALAERKRTEAALQESEQRHHTLYDTMQQGAFYHLADGTLHVPNRAALRMLGLTRWQFLAREAHDPAWLVAHEDGTPFRSDEYPSVVALRTGEPVNGVVACLLNPGQRPTPGWSSTQPRSSSPESRRLIGSR